MDKNEISDNLDAIFDVVDELRKLVKNGLL